MSWDLARRKPALATTARGAGLVVDYSPA